jgi:hypothetical protein
MVWSNALLKNQEDGQEVVESISQQYKQLSCGASD